MLPAAAMLEIALAAGNARHPEAAAIEIRDFAIHACPAAGCRSGRGSCAPSSTRTAPSPCDSRPRLSDEPWTLHATGRVAPLPRLPDAGRDAPAAARRGHPARRAARRRRSAAGLDYGPAFQALDSADGGLGRGHRRCPACGRPPTAPPDAGFLLHPARLDGALQGLIGLLADTPAEAGAGLVPMRFARLAWQRGSPARRRTPASASLARGERSAAADLVLRDAAGEALAVVEAAWLERVRLPGGADAAARSAWTSCPHLPGPNAEAPDGLDLGPALDAARRQDAALDLDEASALLEGICAAAAHAALTAAPASDRAHGPRALAAQDLGSGRAGHPRPGRTAPAAGAPTCPPPSTSGDRCCWSSPRLAPDLAWLALAAERLPGALAGDRLRLDDPADDAVASGPPPGSAALARLASVLAEAVSAFAAAWPRGRPLRVLEIGAGTGPLTARLAAALAATGLRVQLHAAALPGRGRRAAPAARTPAEIELMPAIWDPLGPEPPPVAADLVVGLGTGAALRAGAALPSALRQAVAPGGTLLLAEPLPGRVWDFCCGQDPAWWNAPGGSALLDAAAWAEALTAAGWDAPSPVPLGAAPWPAALIAARAPAGAAVLAAPTLRRVALFAETGATALRDRLAAALTARGATVSNGDLADAASVPPAALRGSLVVALAAGEAATAEALGGSLAALARLAAAADGSAAGFRLVTLGGQQPDGADPARHLPEGAARFALGRVLANEHPGAPAPTAGHLSEALAGRRRAPPGTGIVARAGRRSGSHANDDRRAAYRG